MLLIALSKLIDSSTPAFAVINESAGATKLLGKSWATGLVNANLRNYLRQQPHIAQQYASNPVFQWMQPDWLITASQQAYGVTSGSRIMHGLNTPAPMTLRINRQSTERAAYIALLARQGITAHAGKLAATAVYLQRPMDVLLLPGFSQGLVSVQDEAAQLAADYLQTQPQHRVLDACAAPGGKACHLLECHAGLDLTCLEQVPKRAEKIQHNLDRLHLAAQIHIGDATQTDWWDGQPFDRILLDAPCSGSGIIRRRPDIKLLRRVTDLIALPQQQQHMLVNLWGTLKTGGKLLYSTCSILPEENQAVIQAFLRLYPAARLEYAQQLLPQDGGHDGFYYARLVKT